MGFIDTLDLYSDLEYIEYIHSLYVDTIQIIKDIRYTHSSMNSTYDTSFSTHMISERIPIKMLSVTELDNM